jgi:hypothetical protein
MIGTRKQISSIFDNLCAPIAPDNCVPENENGVNEAITKPLLSHQVVDSKEGPQRFNAK